MPGPTTAASPCRARSATVSEMHAEHEDQGEERHEQRLVLPDRQRDGEQLLPAERDAGDQVDESLRASEERRRSPRPARRPGRRTARKPTTVAPSTTGAGQRKYAPRMAMAEPRRVAAATMTIIDVLR